MTISTETIIINDRYYLTSQGRGVEIITFSDGVSWTLDDILARARMNDTAGAHTLTGSGYRDNIYGRDGNDTINGGDGDDVLVGGAGADTLNGGNDVDTASYETAAQGVKIDLAVTTAQTGYADGDEVGDVLSSIELLRGSDYDDWLAGNDNSNDIWSGSGNDTLYGDDGYDRLYGDEGNDILFGGAGADRIDGGAGVDRASYSNSTIGVSINLQTGDAFGGEAEGDVLVSIERLQGSDAADSLTGNTSANILWGQDGGDILAGGGGADALYGGDGSDTLDGGTGSDTLTGDSSPDTFVFGSGFGIDTISDFQAGGGFNDVIKLQLGTTFDTFAEVMAVTSQVGSDTMITIDASNKIVLAGVLASSLVANDFMFA